MEDREIIRLYFSRSGEAIEQTEQKYGRLYRHIAANTRASPEDREECVNDTYLGRGMRYRRKIPEDFLPL